MGNLTKLGRKWCHRSSNTGFLAFNIEEVLYSNPSTYTFGLSGDLTCCAYEKLFQFILSYSFLFWLIPGKPLSVLDGVPIAVKDEMDCAPYPTTGNLVFLSFALADCKIKYFLMHVSLFSFSAWWHLVLVGGTSWLHKLRPCTGDADCVKYLRLCGALIVGKTNMHELGIGTSGINPHHGWEYLKFLASELRIP